MNRRNFFKIGLAGIGSILADDVGALKYYPKSSEKKWAILYGIWTGTARDAAVWISEGASCVNFSDRPGIQSNCQKVFTP